MFYRPISKHSKGNLAYAGPGLWLEVIANSGFMMYDAQCWPFAGTPNVSAGTPNVSGEMALSM
ncbi:MAG: hypothetical protein ACR5K7_06020 [Symbiopectobacterium sp.]